MFARVGADVRVVARVVHDRVSWLRTYRFARGAALFAEQHVGRWVHVGVASLANGMIVQILIWDVGEQIIKPMILASIYKRISTVFYWVRPNT